VHLSLVRSPERIKSLITIVYLKIDEQRPWGSLSKGSPHNKSPELVERPRGLEYECGTGKEDSPSKRDYLPGLCWDEFQDQVAVPWNEGRLGGLLKETPTA
jgi:hypothetical protein